MPLAFELAGALCRACLLLSAMLSCFKALRLVFVIAFLPCYSKEKVPPTSRLCVAIGPFHPARKASSLVDSRRSEPTCADDLAPRCAVVTRVCWSSLDFMRLHGTPPSRGALTVCTLTLTVQECSRGLQSGQSRFMAQTTMCMLHAAALVHAGTHTRRGAPDPKTTMALKRGFICPQALWAAHDPTLPAGAGWVL